MDAEGATLDWPEVQIPPPDGQFWLWSGCLGSEVAISANDQSLGLVFWLWTSAQVLFLSRCASKSGASTPVRGDEVMGLGDRPPWPPWPEARSISERFSFASGAGLQEKSSILQRTFSPSDSAEWSVRESTWRLMPGGNVTKMKLRHNNTTLFIYLFKYQISAKHYE